MLNGMTMHPLQTGNTKQHGAPSLRTRATIPVAKVSAGRMSNVDQEKAVQVDLFDFSTLERIHFQGCCSVSSVRGTFVKRSERLSAQYKVHVSPMDYTPSGR